MYQSCTNFVPICKKYRRDIKICIAQTNLKSTEKQAFVGYSRDTLYEDESGERPLSLAILVWFDSFPVFESIHFLLEKVYLFLYFTV